MMGNVFSEPSGEPFPSTGPWPEQNESGGGVHIPCHYKIAVIGNHTFLITILNIQHESWQMNEHCEETVSFIFAFVLFNSYNKSAVFCHKCVFGNGS